MKSVITTAVKEEETKTPDTDDAKETKEPQATGVPPQKEPEKKGGKVSLRGWLQRTLKNWRRDFFGQAPQKDGAVLEW